MWTKDFENAVKLATEIINGLVGRAELNGYRGFWNYMAAVASFLAFKELELKEYESKSNFFLKEASMCSLP
jgi:hypothetical protein